MSTAVLQGSLGSFKLPDVLTFLNSTRQTGTLTLSKDGRESYVFFDNGSLIYAGSNQDQFRLAAVLLRKKRITRQQADHIDDLMKREGGRFGQLAVQQGLITDAQLRDYLKVQASEIIYDCFVWNEGTFAFSEKLDLPQHAVTISVDLSNLIMEGARRIEEWEQCLTLLPDKSVIFRVVYSPTAEDKISLSVDEWKILFLINGQRTLEDLCHDAEDDPFQVYKVVYGLSANKLIEIAPAEAPPTQIGTPTGPIAPVILDDETIRQDAPIFGSEKTVRDPREEDIVTVPEKRDDTDLLIDSDAKLSYREMVRNTVAQLTIASGDSKGMIIPLVEPEYLIGRQRDNNIQIVDLGVSGFHARIFRGPTGYVIEDLKSRNGTWLNGTRIFHSSLKDGDQVRLGSTDLTYQVLYEEAQGAEPRTQSA